MAGKYRNHGTIARKNQETLKTLIKGFWLTKDGISGRIKKILKGGGNVSDSGMKKRVWLWVPALFLLLCGVLLTLVLCDTFQRTELVVMPAEPILNVQTPVGKIPVVINGRNLWGRGDGMETLYDGDEATTFVSEETETITLDLGSRRRLAGVRFLPDGEGEQHPNRCIGTRFLVSNTRTAFRPVAMAETKDSKDYTGDWKEILFDSAGEYRFVQVEIPAGGALREIEWLEYGAWNYQPGRRRGTKDFSLGLYASDVKEDRDATILTAVYNQNGVLTRLSKKEEKFRKEKDVSLQLQVPDVPSRKNEKYKIVIWDESGNSLIRQPLQYRDNECAPNLTLPNLFSDDMLFQAEKPLTIWGKGTNGQKVTVTLTDAEGNEVTRQTAVRNDFTWETELGVFPAGGEYTLSVVSGGERKEYRNITFGDVWLCVGQSNMDYFLLAGKDTENYLASETGKKEADNPNIRLVNLWEKGIGGAGGVVENLPLVHGEKAWQVMNEHVAAYCTAVGYFFAQGVEREYDIPVGILSAAVGDTEINRWLPKGQSFGSFTSTDGGLYNNRVEPFRNLQIRGILMYQGEADQYRTHLTTREYRDAMAGLVDLYRSIWGEDLPFYWAQLTRYKKDESAVREGQRLALESIRSQTNAGMISLMDIYGEYEMVAGNCREDIHPHQKREVAERFLRYAKRDVYGAEIPVSGPIYQSAEVIENRMELTFLTTGTLKVLPVEQYADKMGRKKIKESGKDPYAPQEFELAGADGKYYSATASIQGNKIILVSSKVKTPVSARYAWGAYPEMPNLTDESGLPAYSFSTETIE